VWRALVCGVVECDDGARLARRDGRSLRVDHGRDRGVSFRRRVGSSHVSAEAREPRVGRGSSRYPQVGEQANEKTSRTRRRLGMCGQNGTVGSFGKTVTEKLYARKTTMS